MRWGRKRDKGGDKARQNEKEGESKDTREREREGVLYAVPEATRSDMPRG